MVRKPKVTIPEAAPLSIDESDEVAIVGRQEHVSTYMLEDGTKIALTPNVQSFRRHREHFDVNGNPVYSYAANFDFEVTAPDELREKQRDILAVEGGES